MNQGIVYQLENVSRVYDARQVLAIDSLSIRQGEIFVLVGPSGAGKSTLLRMLAFLEPPSAGMLRFEDFTAKADSRAQPLAPAAIRRRVTMVFQRPLLLNASVRENVVLGLRLRGERGLAPRVDPTLARLGLRDFSHVNARTLSGGETQRVALARALVLRTEVLLLDEPTANLDPYNVSLIEGIVKELHASRGVTIIWVTHNVFQARRLATRVGLLLEGRLIEVGDAPGFFESPLDPRTRAFVNGEMIY